MGDKEMRIVFGVFLVVMIGGLVWLIIVNLTQGPDVPRTASAIAIPGIIVLGGALGSAVSHRLIKRKR